MNIKKILMIVCCSLQISQCLDASTATQSAVDLPDEKQANTQAQENDMLNHKLMYLTKEKEELNTTIAEYNDLDTKNSELIALNTQLANDNASYQATLDANKNQINLLNKKIKDLGKDLSKKQKEAKNRYVAEINTTKYNNGTTQAQIDKNTKRQDANQKIINANRVRMRPLQKAYHKALKDIDNINKQIAGVSARLKQLA